MLTLKFISHIIRNKLKKGVQMEPSEQIKALTFLIIAIGLKPKLNYTETETSEILGISTSTLRRMRSQAVGLNYKKRATTSRSNNGKVMYPISAIAEYHFDNIITS